MGYCERLQQHDTLGVFELARRQRLEEGLVLAGRGLRVGAVYILGYSFEITLKCAYFRLRGFRLEEAIDRNTLRTTVAIARNEFGIPIGHDGFHNTSFWAALIVNMRERLACPLSEDVGRQLVARAQRIRSHWRVWLRYRAETVRHNELRDMLEDVIWLQGQYDELSTLR